MEQNQNEKEKPKLKLKDDVSFMEEQPVASATECTGLMPSLPDTEDEAESYADLYSVPAPRQKKDVEIKEKTLRYHPTGDKNA